MNNIIVLFFIIEEKTIYKLKSRVSRRQAKSEFNIDKLSVFVSTEALKFIIF